MRIERTYKVNNEEIHFNSVCLERFKEYINYEEEIIIENKLEIFGSIVKFTYKYKIADNEKVFTEEYIICEIGEEENDDEKLAKALRIIYEKMAEDIVNNILLEN